MSLYALHLANGRTSNTGVLRLMGRLLSGSGVIESTAFTVAAQSTPDMTIKVSGSATADNLVIITSTGDTYHGWNTASANVTITANATGVTKKDHIVAYVDTALTTVTPDNPTGLVLIAVRGTGTAAPTDGEINTATGSKPWLRLAEISISNGASSINSGNITDLRVRIGLGQPVATSRAVKLTSNALKASGDINLTTTRQDIPGCSVTLTPVVDSKILVSATFDFSAGGTGTAAADDYVVGELNVDGSLQAAIAIWRFTSSSNRTTSTQQWLVNLSGGASHTVKMVARHTSFSRGSVVSEATNMTYILFSQ